MFKNIENLKIENINKGTTKSNWTVTNRKANSFMVRTSGSIRYIFSDYSIDVNPGDVIFLPKGSKYEGIVLSDAPSEYVNIRFSAELEDATPSSYYFGDFQDADEFINNLTDLWRFGGMAEHYKCYSMFYNLLSYIERLERLTYADKKKYDVISSAITHLKKHIYDSDLKIETLHQLCGISGTYFRKVFLANYGVSPQKYILGKRLSHAKSIIDCGDFDSISEVAAMVGYNDPLYFSRVFKKKYGMSPSECAKA